MTQILTTHTFNKSTVLRDITRQQRVKFQTRLSIKWLWTIFLFAQFISLTRAFYVENFNLSSLWQDIFTAIAVASVVFLPLIVFLYARIGYDWRQYLPVSVKKWIWLMLALVVLGFLHGVWVGNLITQVIIDTSVYLMIIFCIILGSLPVFWQDVDGISKQFLFAGFVLSVLTFPQITNSISWFNPIERVGVLTLAYDIKSGLEMWPFFLLSSRQRSYQTILFVYAVLGLITLQQILFQKRAPLVLIGLYLVLFIIVQPIIYQRYIPRLKNIVSNIFINFSFIFTLVSFAFISFMLVPTWILDGQLQGLKQRFSDEKYSGLVQQAIIENERYLEVEYMLDSLSPTEYIWGRGFGGYFTVGYDFILELSRENFWIKEAYTVGRREVHIGMFMPFLKGGIILFITYFFIVLMALYRWRTAVLSPLGIAALGVVVLDVIHLSQGGGFILTDSFRLIIVSASIGVCLSTAKMDVVLR